YALDNLNPAVQALGAGQSVAESFAYSINDGNGGTAASTLTITVLGTNDAPVINFNDERGSNGAVTEDTQPEGTTSITTSNTISFSDLDVSDAHTVTSAFVSSTNPNGRVDLGTF